MKGKAWLMAMCTVAIFMLADCGRSGSPHPPEENAPQPVQYLSARGAVRTVSLTWQAPIATATGGDVKGLESFVVQRRDVVGEKTGRFEDVGIVKVEPSEKLKEKHFAFEDPSVVAGRKYDYIVFAKLTDGLEGETDKALRVSFRGETSAVENLGPEAVAR